MAKHREEYANRFARALHGVIVQDQGEEAARKTGQALSACGELVRGEAKAFFSNPIFSLLERQAVLEKILAKKKTPAPLAKFLQVVLRVGRFDLLPEIIDAYAAVDRIHWKNAYFRRDIGHRAIARLRSG